jgi:hypothetical protein
MVKHTRPNRVGVSGFDSRVGGAYLCRYVAPTREGYKSEEKSQQLDITLYQVHLHNERELTDAFEIACFACKDAIRTADERRERILTKNCALLLGAKLETTLMRIIYAPIGFRDSQRQRLLSTSTASDRWLRVVREAFAKRHNLTVGQVPRQLPFTARARFDEMERLIREQFIPLIELRNSLAHGQWYRTLNSSGLKVDSRRMEQLATQNLWRLTIQNNLLQHMADLIYDLVVTRYAFERDFDKRWGDLRSATMRLESGSGEKWAQMLRERYQRRWQYIKQQSTAVP